MAIQAITPAAAPPPGLVSNFVDPPSTAATVVILSSIFLPVSILSVCLRMYTRARLIRLVGSDDCKFKTPLLGKGELLTATQTWW